MLEDCPCDTKNALSSEKTEAIHTADDPYVRAENLTAAQFAVLRAVCAEPGERTVRQLGSQLGSEPGLTPRVTATAVHHLSRIGLLAPRLYRTHPHARVGPFDTELERRIVPLCRQVHLTKAQLAVAVGLSPTTGALNRALKRLHSWGSISMPAELWPSPLGRRVAELLTLSEETTR